MTGTAASLILSFLLSVAIGSGFHLAVGGSANRLILYIFSATLGFILGHFIGQGLQSDTWKLGVIYLLPAAFGAIVMLLLVRWLWPDQNNLP